jgi:hypothetical protein
MIYERTVNTPQFEARQAREQTTMPAPTAPESHAGQTRQAGARMSQPGENNLTKGPDCLPKQPGLLLRYP